MLNTRSALSELNQMKTYIAASLRQQTKDDYPSEADNPEQFPHGPSRLSDTLRARKSHSPLPTFVLSGKPSKDGKDTGTQVG